MELVLPDLTEEQEHHSDFPLSSPIIKNPIESYQWGSSFGLFFGGG
jgi:hypothetical protein